MIKSRTMSYAEYIGRM